MGSCAGSHRPARAAPRGRWHPAGRAHPAPRPGSAQITRPVRRQQVPPGQPPLLPAAPPAAEQSPPHTARGVTNTAMDAAAAVRMTGVLISPAAMAASPMIRAAIRLTECPRVWGIRRPASRMISNIRITSSISPNSGSGVACSAASILNSSWGGRSSGR